MANEQHFDLVVIGSGPGGYVGAIRAAQLGMKTAIVERNRLGGVCLNWGCIPSKALLHVAEAYSESVTHGSEWGLSFEKASVDWSKVIASSRSAADKLNKGVGFLMKKNSITTIEDTRGSSPPVTRTSRARSRFSRPMRTTTTAVVRK